MSSTSYPTPNSTRTEIRSYAHETLMPGHTIVADTITSTGHAARDWSTVGYFAIRTETGLTFARVILGTKEGGNFYVKVQDEDMGPRIAHGVTGKILNALTPTAAPQAQAWRDRAYRALRQRSEGKRILRHLAALGGILELNTTLYYQQTGPVDMVRVEPGGAWICPEDYFRLAPPADPWQYVKLPD